MASGVSRLVHLGARSTIWLGVVTVITAAVVHPAALADSSPAKALRIPSTSMTSQTAVRRAISAARSGGFDTVVVPISVRLTGDPNVADGEAQLVRQARESGLRVHVSIAVNLAVAVGELPSAREHVVYQHPEWLMVPREAAVELLTIDARSPAYFGRLSRWTRANADRVSGVYVSPVDPEAASYLVTAVARALTRHAADGVYLEALDFPGEDFDYSRRAMDLFRARTRNALPPVERARVDEIEAIDPFAYEEEFPDAWRTFRESALTRLLERLRSTLIAVNPSLVVTVGTAANPDTSLSLHFQNWRAWLSGRIVDRIGFPGSSSDVVLFSADGAIPLDSAPLTSPQTNVSGSR
jgi:hypothetical protein